MPCLDIVNEYKVIIVLIITLQILI